MKVHRITRVHNRILRTRFDDKLDQILEKDDIMELTKYEQLILAAVTNNCYTFHFYRIAPRGA